MGAASLQRDRTGTRNRFFWFFLIGLVISLLCHLLFMKRAENWVMPGFSAASYDTIVPRTFRMKRVEIDPKTLEETKEIKKQIVPVPVSMAKEKPFPSQTVRQEGENNNLLTTPKEIPAIEKTTRENNDIGGATILPSINWKGSAEKQAASLEKTTTVAPLVLPEPNEKNNPRAGQGGTASAMAKQQYSNLDQLLEGEGVITSGTAPILMPTDLLFEYDSDQLKPAAAQSLEKLGELIRKNRQSTFRIEGYTDSFGSDDYNLGLSTRRAEAVKVWLEKNMGVDPARVTTAGLGKRRLLVPASGTVEQQQLNRRVEIVITTH
jgi:outer membrane protein OmpA-like peptidoglycan-associated protein